MFFISVLDGMQFWPDWPMRKESMDSGEKYDGVTDAEPTPSIWLATHLVLILLTYA